MKKFASIFKNKEIVGRIFFTIMILFVIRIGAAITVPGVKTTSSFTDAMNSGNAIAMMNLLGGGALSNFSVFALGVSPYITSQIIVQLLSKDVLPALTELSKQGQYGRKKIEMATRYLTLLLGAVQAYGIIMMMQNSSYISLTLSTSGGGAFWTYLYIITVLLAGAMLTMWLGDQITEKGLGNGISIIIFASSILMAPTVIASFISADAAQAPWLKIFSYSEMFTMPWFNGGTWKMPWGLLIYLTLIIVFTFFYSEMQIDPESLADNFQKNGSYIPGIRPGKATERYVRRVLNRVTCIGAIALAAISALPVALTLSGVFGGDSSLALGGTGMIIIVGVAIELNSQIDGLLAGKSFDEVRGGMA